MGDRRVAVDRGALALAGLVQPVQEAAYVDGMDPLLAAPEVPEWRRLLVFSLAEAADAHPLGRRLLAGLEPEVTDRVLEMPALADLRRACVERIRAEQKAGTVRLDIDPVTMGNGIVAIILSLLMSLVQIGQHSAHIYADDVAAVFDAALRAPVAPPGPPPT